MSKYVFDGEELYQYSCLLRQLTSTMLESYNLALQLQTEVENTTAWAGKTHDAMVAFLDLMLMFHNKLSLDSPVDAAIADYETLYQILSDFYSSFQEYLEMNKI